MRKVFLDELPRYTGGLLDGKINWRNSIGISLKFIYDEIEDAFTIIDYRSNGKAPQVYLEYNGNKEWVYTTRLLNSKIANFIKTKKECVPRIIDLSGQRFGKLTVLCDDGNRSNTGQIRWKCMCDCGEITHVVGNKLKTGHTKSCGCLSNKHFKQKYYTNNELRKTAVSRIIGRYKSKAIVRSISWNISQDTFEEMIEKPCYYCGMTHSLSMTIQNYDYKYNGIDRVDSSRGYEKNNIVTCCKFCNMAKSDMSQSDFYQHIIKTAEYIKDNRLKGTI